MIHSEYKLFAFKLLKFLFVFLIIDFTLGSLAKQIFLTQKSGKYARLITSIYKTTDKILIFGSSHANRHYVPEIFEKELKQTCFNAGMQGQKLIFINALQKLILKRTIPNLIILNIDEDWMVQSEDAYDKLADLHPFYWENRDILKPIFKLRSNFIDLILFFKCYQTNSTIVHVIKYFLFPQPDFDGYRPLYGHMEPPTKTINKINNVSKEKVEEIDENFVNAFKSFIIDSKINNINLFFVVTPVVWGADYSKSSSMNIMRTIAEKENIPFYDFSNDIRFLNNYDLFYDDSHLNHEGAVFFTEILVEIIKTNKINY
jgi:hypothetical protein